MKNHILCVLVTGTISLLASAQPAIKDFRVQNAVEPIAVDDRHPEFSWRMESSRTGAAQKAYQIVVTRDSDSSLLWDSGKVEDSRSTGISYRGVALQADMGYSVKLKVWDDEGTLFQESTRFETGLMSPRKSAWKGAQWIGSDEVTLDAASECVFSISTRVNIISGGASLIFGADDFRLRSNFFNSQGVSSAESYIRLDLRKNGIDIFRVGYFPSDKAGAPLLSVPAQISGGEHELLVEIEASALRIFLDGEELPLGVPSFSFNPNGSGGDRVTFPNLCSVGFAAEPGWDARFRDYKILRGGHTEDRIAFDSSLYNIFEGLPGVKINGNAIRVSNNGKKPVKGWADPSHGAETQLRTIFTAGKKVRRARLFASAMGIYNMSINGKPVSEDWFAPGQIQYRELMGYQKYDVTSLLREGENTISASLGEGWWSGYMTFVPSHLNFFGEKTALIARLVITYEDGTKEEVTTSPETWEACKDGPVRLGSFFQGEHYDARREGALTWTNAKVIKPREWIDFDFVSRCDEPVRVREILTAQRIMPAHNAHTYIYDMGVNMVGVPEITIPEGWLSEGQTVIITCSEQLYSPANGKEGGEEGHLVYEINRAAMDADFYTPAGSGAVTIRPTKTFRGYQYIQIYIPSHEGALPLENVKGLVFSSIQVPTGAYNAVTSDGNRTGELVNRLFKNIQRSQLGNYLSIPTDCPQRNERMGWTGDAQVYVRTGTYNADVQNFMRQWMVSLRADQGVGSDTEAPGGMDTIVPSFRTADDDKFLQGTTWGAAVCQVPWQIFCQYGDTLIVRENMEAMLDWLNGLAFYRNKDYPYLSTRTDGLADHLSLDGGTQPEILNNAIYIRMMEVTAIMADAIGRSADAKMLRKRHDRAVEDWNAAFVDPETGRTRGLDGEIIHTQASYATPLNFNCFNERNKDRAAAHLAELCNDGAILTGFSGTPNILPALSRYGHGDTAWKMITSTDYPSWLHQLNLGATTIWERWNWSKNYSFNHYALGSVGEWMFEYQLGITSGEEPGYKHFVLQPGCGANYTSLEGSFESNYGRIESAWTASGSKMTSYRCTVPANTSATLFLPLDGTWEALDKEGVTYEGTEEHLGLPCARYSLTSGSFGFRVVNTYAR